MNKSWIYYEKRKERILERFLLFKGIERNFRKRYWGVKKGNEEKRKEKNFY